MKILEIEKGDRYGFYKDGIRHTGVVINQTKECVSVIDDENKYQYWLAKNEVEKLERGENTGIETGIL